MRSAVRGGGCPSQLHPRRRSRESSPMCILVSPAATGYTRGALEGDGAGIVSQGWLLRVPIGAAILLGTEEAPGFLPETQRASRISGQAVADDTD